MRFYLSLPVGAVPAAQPTPVGLGEFGNDGVGATLPQIHRDHHLSLGDRQHVVEAVLF